MARGACVWLLLLCIGCSSEKDAQDPPPAPSSPGAVGPYAVGVTTIETVSEGRTLPIEVWYPASIAEGAEVVGYDAFMASGSMAACRDKGELRLEGKEYIVQDGDIINFRHAT